MSDEKIKILEKPTTVLNYYKKIGLLVPIGISCTWKCKNCINRQHTFKNSNKYHISEYEIGEIIKIYKKNILVESLILAGLEPFDNPHDLRRLIGVFRDSISDDIIIYTGYDNDDIDTNKELKMLLQEILKYDNILVKFGRYIEGKDKIYDNVLGIELASDNQWTFRSDWLRDEIKLRIL